MDIYTEQMREDRIRREVVGYLDYEIKRLRAQALLDGLVDGWLYDDGISDSQLLSEPRED